MTRLRLWLARLRLRLARMLLPSGWVAVPAVKVEYRTEPFVFGCWPEGSVLHTLTVRNNEPHADTLGQDDIAKGAP